MYIKSVGFKKRGDKNVFKPVNADLKPDRKKGNGETMIKCSKNCEING